MIIPFANVFNSMTLAVGKSLRIIFILAKPNPAIHLIWIAKPIETPARQICLLKRKKVADLPF